MINRAEQRRIETIKRKLRQGKLNQISGEDFAFMNRIRFEQDIKGSKRMRPSLSWAGTHEVARLTNPIKIRQERFQEELRAKYIRLFMQGKISQIPGRILRMLEKEQEKV